MVNRVSGPRNSPSFLWRGYHIFVSLLQKSIEKRTDVIFISFPKSGRSWLRVMLGKYLCEKFQVPDRYIVNTFQLTSRTKVMRTIFTHYDVSSNPDSRFSKDKSNYKGKKVILLTRNMKDVLVSFYFQETKRGGRFDSGISDFLWSENSPVLSYITYHNAWFENRDVPQEFLHLTYEETQENPEDVLVKMLKFIGLVDIEENLVKEAVAFASFDNMRKMERENKLKSSRYKPGDPHDEESFKTRRGVIGGYIDYLSEDDIEIIDMLAKKLGSPFVHI